MASLIKTNIAESGRGIKGEFLADSKSLYFQPNGNGSIAI